VGHGEKDACFGGMNLALPRACSGLPISPSLKIFHSIRGMKGDLTAFQKAKLLPNNPVFLYSNFKAPDRLFSSWDG
jgi:hypothetical protein